MGTAPGDGGDLQGRDHEDKSAGHSQKCDKAAVLLQCLPYRKEACGQEGNTQDPPGNAETSGKITFHNVHGAHTGHDAEGKGKGGTKGQDTFLLFTHFLLLSDFETVM